MKVRLEDHVQHFRTVWLKDNIVEMIDQNKLPHSFEILRLEDYKATAKAIKDMNIRGAGAIGAAAGYAMAQAALGASIQNSKSFFDDLDSAADYIKSMRPTAQDLFYAVDKVLEAAKSFPGVPFSSRDMAVQAAEDIANANAKACQSIGRNGEPLIRNGFSILTHCNAGWLAFADYGSALSPIYAAKNKGKDVFVWVDETRPRLQGARLTAWELSQENIDHRIISDNLAGCLMWQGKVDMVIVGSDRIAANGDVANKIGTYKLAVLAKENNIPFYVAAPTSTIDLDCPSGKDIPIEERSEDEVLYIDGFCDRTKRVEKVKISSGDSQAYNYAFDITPRKYVSGIITEKGVILKPTKEDIKELFD
ncbi:MAG: S-methyl-5-thioribose-1-phosphate isomerase [Nanoarchaeota archaeon]|nr:S-methyl-5-thioribose-1-phosphate isomerase [Nanoarchaeota archaeon]